MSTNGRTHIVILGAGFGGVYTAMYLEKLLAHERDVDITLVNRENFFLFTPMLHEVAASDLDITHIVNPIRKLLHRANFFEGDVEYIDLPNKCVGVSHGYEPHAHELPYDHLVLALGSITNFFNLPGLEDHALTMKSLGDAIQIRNRLIANLEEASSECADRAAVYQGTGSPGGQRVYGSAGVAWGVGARRLCPGARSQDRYVLSPDGAARLARRQGAGAQHDRHAAWWAEKAFHF
jgi:NADH dehydrogenase FAD-containing subunit